MYSLVFADELADEIAAIDSPFERRKVFSAIQCLTLDPLGSGIAEAIDGHGRINRVGLAGGVAYVFWVDHAMHQIRILAMQSVVE